MIKRLIDGQNLQHRLGTPICCLRTTAYSASIEQEEGEGLNMIKRLIDGQDLQQHRLEPAIHRVRLKRQ